MIPFIGGFIAGAVLFALMGGEQYEKGYRDGVRELEE